MSRPRLLGPPVSYRLPLAYHALLVAHAQRLGVSVGVYTARLVAQDLKLKAQADARARGTQLTLTGGPHHAD